jgi:hypothetical protein
MVALVVVLQACRLHQEAQEHQGKAIMVVVAIMLAITPALVVVEVLVL